MLVGSSPDPARTREAVARTMRSMMNSFVPRPS
jgi:hypothetical protein